MSHYSLYSHWVQALQKRNRFSSTSVHASERYKKESYLGLYFQYFQNLVAVILLKHNVYVGWPYMYIWANLQNCPVPRQSFWYRYPHLLVQWVIFCWKVRITGTRRTYLRFDPVPSSVITQEAASKRQPGTRPRRNALYFFFFFQICDETSEYF